MKETIGGIYSSDIHPAARGRLRDMTQQDWPDLQLIRILESTLRGFGNGHWSCLFLLSNNAAPHGRMMLASILSRIGRDSWRGTYS